MDELDREIEREEYIEAAMKRLQVELGWYRMHMKYDYRGELSDLIDEHFAGLRNLAMAFMGMASAMKEAGIPYKTVEQHMDLIMEQLMALGPHAEKFKELYRKMPDRNDMYLATIETPPRKM